MVGYERTSNRLKEMVTCEEGVWLSFIVQGSLRELVVTRPNTSLENGLMIIPSQLLPEEIRADMHDFIRKYSRNMRKVEVDRDARSDS
jgi:hypothetical protein